MPSLATPLRTLAALICGATLLHAQTPASRAAVAPDSAGHLAAWAAALNDGSPAAIRAYVLAHLTVTADDTARVERIVGRLTDLARQSGGVVLHDVAQRNAELLTAAAQFRRTSIWNRVDVFLDSAPPHKVRGTRLGGIEAPVGLLERRSLSDTEVAGRLDTLMTHMAENDGFSGVVLLDRAGRTVYGKAFGVANRMWNIRNDMSTRFASASITKMFTAVAIGQLVESGRLSFADTISRLLPDYPNRDVAARITVHELLSHTSGMIGAQELEERNPEPLMARTIDDRVKLFAAESLRAIPGQTFLYSNAGYVVLGAIIERLSGQSYVDYVQQHVFAPAGMLTAAFDELDRDCPPRADGFGDAESGSRTTNRYNLPIRGVAFSGAYTSAADLVAFHKALREDRLLRRETRERLWSGVIDDGDGHDAYGYGAFATAYNGQRMIWHGGGWVGITNHFEMYPESGVTFVVLSNYDTDPRAVAHKVREWVTQRPRNSVAAERAPVLHITTEVTPGPHHIGDTLDVAFTIENAGGTARATIIDMEVHDSSGEKTHQQFFEGQRLVAGNARTFRFRWVLTHAGVFTIDAGLFTSGWARRLEYRRGAQRIEIQAP